MTCLATASPRRFWSVGAIAEQHDVPVARIVYILRTRAIAPIGWVGNARVYDDAAVQQIGAALEKIARIKEEAARGE
jgi:hypothetical protein